MSTNHVMTCTQNTMTQKRLIRIYIISRIQQMLTLVVDYPALPSCSPPELSVTMSQPHTQG